MTKIVKYSEGKSSLDNVNVYVARLRNRDVRGKSRVCQEWIGKPLCHWILLSEKSQPPLHPKMILKPLIAFFLQSKVNCICSRFRGSLMLRVSNKICLQNAPSIASFVTIYDFLESEVLLSMRKLEQNHGFWIDGWFYQSYIMITLHLQS